MKKITYKMLYRPYSYQHCIGTLYSQCCPYTSKTTLHKKYLSDVSAERIDMFLQGNNLYNVALICLYQRCTRKLFTCAMFTTVHEQLYTGK